MRAPLQQDRKGRRRRRLFDSGIRGRGRIVKASSWGTLNAQPIVRLVLDLEVPAQEARRVKRHLVVSDFASGRLRPGLELPVYVDPSDRDEILIVW